MTDISELEQRLTAALDKIGAGIEGLTSARGGDEAAQLSAALDEERMVNAQLEERVRAIKQKQDQTVARLEGEVERLRGLLDREERALSQVTRANAELRANNAALREAIAEGVAEPHLVNKSMMAELEALRASHGADRAELEAVLGELTPHLAGDAVSDSDEEMTDA